MQTQINNATVQGNKIPVKKGTVNLFPGHNSGELNKKTFSDKINDLENRFSSLVEIIPCSLVIAELISGRVLYFNSKALQLFEVDKEHLLSKDFFEYFVYSDNLSDVLKEVQEFGSIEKKEVQLFKESKIHFIGNISARLDIYGDKKVLIMNIEDGSQDNSERLLEELRISKEQIEEEAAKMNIDNYKLEESEQKLQELNAAKDKLFSIIGHDLRNPFFIISSYSDMLKEDYGRLTDKERDRIVNTIGDTARYAHRLLENLLNWARSQTGRMEYTPSPLQLKKIVSSSLEVLYFQAQKKNITISIEIPVYLMVRADKNMIDTILRNLAANAVKFTEPGGSVKITASDFNEFVKVTVEETGIGLSDKDVSKLFKIDTKNNEIGGPKGVKEKGTGLGLIICKEFVERHGGQIWAESEVGKGSQFYFTIPRIRTFA